MRGQMWRVVFGALVAVFFVSLLGHTEGWAQKLPKGVKAELVAEYPGNTSGIEKVQLMKFTFQPGAILKDYVEPHTAL